MEFANLVERRGRHGADDRGREKVCFPSPVPVGGRIRAGATLDSATPIDGGVHVVLTISVELEGGTKPAMVATTVVRRYL